MALVAPETGRTRTGGRSGRSPDPDFAEAEGAGAVLARFVAALEAERYSGDDSVTLVTFFTRMERLCGAAKALAARRVEEARSHLRSGHRSTAELLAARTGDSLGEAKDLLRLGGHLADQPTLDQALRDGRLSRRRAALVAEAARVNPAQEAELVEGATHDSEARFKERCLRAKAQGRTPEEEARHHQRLHERRRCRTFTDTEGAFRLDALLPPRWGPRCARPWRPTPTGSSSGPSGPGSTSPTTPRRRRPGGPGLPAGGPRPRDHRPGPRRPVRDPPRTPGPPCSSGATSRPCAGARWPRASSVRSPGSDRSRSRWVHEQLGEALCHLVVTDGVDVTTLYSPGRHLPLPVRAALVERDSRCVVPGCDARLGLENDHWARDFAQGGPTSLDNLARVCHHHHQLRTHQGFQLTGGPGRWRWTAPEHPVVPAAPPVEEEAEGPGPATPGHQPAPVHRPGVTGAEGGSEKMGWSALGTPTARRAHHRTPHPADHHQRRPGGRSAEP